MSTEITFPVGRMVAGSVYLPKTTDADGNPLVIKKGINAGQPRVDYYFAVAIPKGVEPHWNVTPWGQQIYQEALSAWPTGQHQIPTFSWKVSDGDSATPNTRGTAPNTRVGWPGHWVVHFSSSFAPKLYNADGSQVLAEPDAIKCGYFIQVYGSVKGNDSTQQPGVYLNHSYVALSGFGDVIETGADPASVGFGGALPAGASTTPPAAMTATPAVTPAVTPTANFANPTGVPTGVPGVVPPPPVDVHTMTQLAGGVPYEQYIASGWTDDKLRAAGLMQ